MWRETMEKTHTRTHTCFLTNEYIHNVDAQMETETLTPKPHHKDTSQYDLSRLFVGIK